MLLHHFEASKMIVMPFGMGPYGWFMLPYLMSQLGYPYYGRYPTVFPPTLPYLGSMVSYPYGASSISREEEAGMLEEQSRFLERQLSDVRQRIEELRKQQ